MRSSKSLQETVEIFLIDTIPNLNSREYGMSFVRFSFSDEALDILSKYADSIFIDELKKNAKKSVQILRKNKVESSNEMPIIEVKNYVRFFELLTEIKENFNKNILDRSFRITGLFKSIWLRMGVEDFNDVESFLQRQLKFIKNDSAMGYLPTIYKKYNDGLLVYENDSNYNWFETNNYIKFSIVKKLEDNNKNDDNPLLNLLKSRKYYDLPAIHYGFVNEDGEAVCYIYGIQNIRNVRRDIEAKELIIDEKKKLRNKYVSPDFIMGLNFFIEFLKDNGITKIKVPMLQVFNYDYHQALSNSIKESYGSYDEELKKDLENRYANGEKSDFVKDYIHDKKTYERFADKEDLISKNKTERLIYTLMMVEEKYGNINIINEPFIEGDTLIVNIKDNKKKDDIGKSKI